MPLLLAAPSIIVSNDAYAAFIEELELEGPIACLQLIDDELTYLLHGPFEIEVDE
jgi:hypothetical protein